MSRVVVFVEGQVEQIFIRELLFRHFGYNSAIIAIRCYKLNAESLDGADYHYGNDDAENFFEIIDAGGDNKVLSAMIKRSPKMLEVGFSVIIGLRDMYSKQYNEISPGSVSKEINAIIIDEARKSIHSALGDIPVHIHYAIMEVETWMLALIDKWKGDVSQDEIDKILSPETYLESIYHPVEVVKEITKLKKEQVYDKHARQVNSIISKIEWSDYWALYKSGKCPAFNEFLRDLLNLE